MPVEDKLAKVAESSKEKRLMIVDYGINIAPTLTRATIGIIILATTPALLGYIPLWLAVILHEGGTVIVGFNSLRLLRSK